MSIKFNSTQKGIDFGGIVAKLPDWQQQKVAEEDYELAVLTNYDMSITHFDPEVITASAKAHEHYVVKMEFNERAVKQVTDNSVLLSNGILLTCIDSHVSYHPLSRVLTIEPNSDNIMIEVSEIMQAQSMFWIQSSENEHVVPSEYAIPSVSLGVYDYYDPFLTDEAYSEKACVISRPVRLGLPVISTIPVPDNLQTVWSDGIPDTIKLHFLAIVNEYINPATDDNVVLQVFLPGGIDTLQNPINVPMLRLSDAQKVNLPDTVVLSDDDVNNITHTAYICEYTFNKANARQYIDGFAYFNVHIPMEISGSISGDCQTQ